MGRTIIVCFTAILGLCILVCCGGVPGTTTNVYVVPPHTVKSTDNVEKIEWGGWMSAPKTR